MTYHNKAAWITHKNAHPFKVDVGPVPAPEADEVVIKVAAVGINPSEWKFQELAYLEVNYPHVLGSDCAGTVVQVGAEVSNLKVGDRVLGYCLGLITKKPTDAAFQLYATTKALVTTVVPPTLPFTSAAVLPLSVITAAVGLYQHLGLPLPASNKQSGGSRTATTSIVLLWGGSSSCGSSAVQLAIASGASVITTASPHNFSYVKSLVPKSSQADVHVFNHGDGDVVEQIVAAIAELKSQGKVFKGAYDLIGTEDAMVKTAEVLQRIGGEWKLPTVLWPAYELPKGVEAFIVWASSPATDAKDIGHAVFQQYLPKGLADGSFLAKPGSFVIDGGLEKIQEAVDLLKQGVSARKIVVKIEE